MRATFIIIPIMLVCGTCYSITQKVLLQQKSHGYNNIEHEFDKPFTQTLLMIIAMMSVLFIHRRWDSTGPGPHPPTPLRTRIILAIPASFDLITTTLNIFGLIYINVSIYQMLRSAHIIFTSILSIIFLKRRLHVYEFIGITLVIIALILVGWSGLYTPSSEITTHYSTGKKLLGAFLIIIAQVFHSSQVVLEEYFLKVFFAGKLGALEVTGNEGLMGFLILIFFAFPLAFVIPGNDPSPMSGGSLENIWDTMLMVYHNPILLVIFVVYIISAGGYNITAMLVIAFTSSLNEAIIDAIRTLLIWVCMLLASVMGLPFGEKWNRYSFMELAGFVLIVTGNFMYNGYLKLPCFTYPPPENDGYEQPGTTPLIEPQ